MLSVEQTNVPGVERCAGRHLEARKKYFPSEYATFYKARHRCINSKDTSFKDYGGRGIQFLFTSFEQFFEELGPRPKGLMLDRTNNDGNYEPGNVRWATRTVQNNNQRASSFEVSGRGGRKAQALHPNMSAENGRKGDRAGKSRNGKVWGPINFRKALEVEGFTKRRNLSCTHARWHVRRGITNPNCNLCMVAAGAK